jgi:hypothetical protein
LKKLIQERVNEKKTLRVLLYFIFWFWPSLRIVASTDGDGLEFWMLLE